MSLKVLYKKQEFRSTREKVVYFGCSFCVMAALILPASFLDVHPVRYYAYFLGVAFVSVTIWLSWLRWGRERFPLPPADESQSAA